MDEKKMKVCVTGGAGYLGSSLVKKLLERGYTVHATLRKLDDPLKVGVLSSLPYADTRLRLFEADMHLQSSRVWTGYPRLWYKSTSEAAVAGVKSIVSSCLSSGTVKRIIYTASVVAASPLKDDGTGFKDSMDESCWTPLNLSFAQHHDMMAGYVQSKTMAEKEVLSYNGTGSSLEVVSLACGLVGGDTLSSMAESNGVLISQVTRNERQYQTLRFLEELLGKVPIVHIDDVLEAHIFCMESSSINGRFLCARAYLSSAEIASYCRRYYPDMDIAEEFIENMNRGICWGSTKLKEMGFEYKYDIKTIIDESLKCARKMGDLI